MRAFVVATVALLLTVVASLVAAHDGSYTQHEVKFATHDKNGLVWPLPNSQDLVSLLIHAVHCKHMVQMNNTDNAMGKMHVAHCGKVQKMIEAQPVPDVSKALCNTLFGLSATYYKKVAALGSYSYYTDNSLQTVNKGRVLTNPADDLAQLAGTNYGVLLMKEWETPEKLTAAEKSYLQSWFSPVAMQQSAIAYRCQALGVAIYELADEVTGKHRGHFVAKN